MMLYNVVLNSQAQKKGINLCFFLVAKVAALWAKKNQELCVNSLLGPFTLHIRMVITYQNIVIKEQRHKHYSNKLSS